MFQLNLKFKHWCIYQNQLFLLYHWYLLIYFMVLYRDELFYDRYEDNLNP
jgi:hypothetical protein